MVEEGMHKEGQIQEQNEPHSILSDVGSSFIRVDCRGASGLQGKIGKVVTCKYDDGCKTKKDISRPNNVLEFQDCINNMRVSFNARVEMLLLLSNREFYSPIHNYICLYIIWYFTYF